MAILIGTLWVCVCTIFIIGIIYNIHHITKDNDDE